MKYLLLALAVAALVFLISLVALPAGRPDVQRVRRDFLADFPTYTIERVVLEDVEFSEMCYRIVYYTPSDTEFHVELRHYMDEGGKWNISRKVPLN